MTLIFNLDLDKLTKITDYSFSREENPFGIFYFRLYQNGYAVDMDKFNRLRMIITSNSSGEQYLVDITKVVTINGEELVEVKLDDRYLIKNDKLIIKPTVTYSNQSIILKEFNLIIYEGSKVEMNLIKQGLVRFNQMYNLYIKAIKRDQINKPNGVIGLDSDGRMSIDQLPEVVGQHVQTKIRDVDIHGLRLNDKFMLEVYDKDDDYWWEANVLHGGFFGFPNKPKEYNVFGGYWGEIPVAIANDAGGFTDNILESYDGGSFTDSNSLPPLHAGKF